MVLVGSMGSLEREPIEEDAILIGSHPDPLILDDEVDETQL